MNNMEERIPERYQGIKAEPPKYKEYRIVSPVEKHMVKYALDLGYKIKLDDFLGSVPCPFKWEFPGGISENADCFVSALILVIYKTVCIFHLSVRPRKMHLILQVFYNQMFTKYAAILNIHHKYPA